MPLDKLKRGKWIAAGYPEGMGSSRVVLPPDHEFRRVYHLTSANYAIASIAMRRLKVSRFADLNDPFEAMGPMWRRLEDRARVGAIREKWNGKLGLLCFSSDWISPVLWSHYGDKHKGVCLGFDVPRSTAKKVIYTADRLNSSSREMERLVNAPDAPEEVLLTKFKHWAYEGEYRSILNLAKCSKEGPLHFIPFSDTLALTEIILGDLCTLDLAAVRSLASCYEMPPVVFRARLAGKSYNVVPDGDSV